LATLTGGRFCVVPGTPSFDRAVAGLGPWWFRFERDGVPFGGPVERDTERVSWFFGGVARLRGDVRTVLELGSHEGNHSLQLAGRASVQRVVALEGRPDNLARARFVQRVFGDGKIVFREYDLERLDSSDFEDRFDAVFCAGVLYHLPRPWRLIAELSRLCRRYLFLDTHHAWPPEATAEGYMGRWVGEGPDPLSGLSPSSFWLTLPALIEALRECGFHVRFMRELQVPNGLRALVLAERVSEAA
jgi:SAM-dependent methyltransferase